MHDMKGIYISILAALWIAFYLYWLISAISTKKSVRSNRPYAAVRIGFIIILVALLYGVRGFRRFVTIGATGPIFNIAGLVICALGISLAIWARVCIGRNWGTPMSFKENPELVTSGPYRFIRHPIYSGILLALLGSALVCGIVWFILFLFFGTYFVLASRGEESLMTRQFPDQYPEYMKRTRALVPFVY